MAETQTLERNTEYETKYGAKLDDLPAFKAIAEAIPGLKRFVYVDGLDQYYRHPSGGMMRHRTALHGFEGGRQELTVKLKGEGAKDNINRREWNVRVDGTPHETIDEMIRLGLGMEKDFLVWKSCNIYELDDATLVFYTVVDRTPGAKSAPESFIEIEVNEATIHTLTEEQARAVILKYEALLAPIGITPQRRMRKSLLERYTRRGQ
jgi:adenylate cyclase class IV